MVGLDPATAAEHGLSYTQLAAMVPALAAQISAHARDNEVVMLAGVNEPAFVAWFCAGLAAGVRLLLLPPLLTTAEIDDLAERSQAIAIIAHGSVQGRASHLRRLDWDLARADYSNAPDAHGIRGTGSVILVTSGTMGSAKLAWRGAAALDADGENVAHALRLTEQDRLLVSVPLSHSYGVDMLAASLVAGATLEVTRSFDASRLSDRLAHGVTVFPGVPFMFDALATCTPPHPTPAGALRLAFNAGGLLPARVRAAFERNWCIPIGDLYGASELGAVTFADPSMATHQPGTAGLPMRGVTIRVLDPENLDQEAPVGREGHVAVRAPSMLTSYLDGDLPIRDGHLLTGDLGHVDDTGRLLISGRIKLLIDTGGVKVNPLEVEAALASHAGVAECVVVPLPLSDTVTRLRAVFVPRDRNHPPTGDELRAFLKRTLSSPKVPRRFDCVDSLPKTPTGKVLRQALAGGGS